MNLFLLTIINWGTLQNAFQTTRKKLPRGKYSLNNVLFRITLVLKNTKVYVQMETLVNLKYNYTA